MASLHNRSNDDDEDDDGVIDLSMSPTSSPPRRQRSTAPPAPPPRRPRSRSPSPQRPRPKSPPISPPISPKHPTAREARTEHAKERREEGGGGGGGGGGNKQRQERKSSEIPKSSGAQPFEPFEPFDSYADKLYPRMRPATDDDVAQTNSAARVLRQTGDVIAALQRNPPSEAAFKCNDMSIPNACFFKSKAKNGWAFSNFFRCIVRLRITDPDPNVKRDGVYVFGSSEHAYQWVARVYPNDKSEATLLRWCGGGMYDQPPPAKQAQPKKRKADGAGGDADAAAPRKQKNASSATADKEANCAAGLHAKLLVGKNEQYALKGLASNPHAQGLSVNQEFLRIWRPILVAKYTQTPKLTSALLRTGSDMLVEYSKAFNRANMGGFVKDGGASFRRPELNELQPAMLEEWRKERWAGNIIKHPVHKTLHAFGYNVMGDFLMRVRTIVSTQAVGKDGERRSVPYVPWPNTADPPQYGSLFGVGAAGRTSSSNKSSSSSMSGGRRNRRSRLRTQHQPLNSRRHPVRIQSRTRGRSASGRHNGDNRTNGHGRFQAQHHGRSPRRSKARSKARHHGHSPRRSKARSKTRHYGRSPRRSKARSKARHHGHSRDRTQRRAYQRTKGQSCGGSRGRSQGKSRGRIPRRTYQRTKGLSRGQSRGRSQGQSRGQSQHQSRGQW